MSRTPIVVGFCVCVLGVLAGLFAPLELLGLNQQPRDVRPLILPTGELPRKEAVGTLLRERRYDELQRIYGLTLSEDQRSATDDLYRFRAFAYADPALEEAFNGWAEAHKESPLPLIARGQYHLHLAYTVRGDKFVADTSSEQFEEMNRLLDLARQDFTRANEIGPPSVAAYEGQIDIAITGGKRREARPLLERALTATDNPLPLHLAYMRSLEARWGGSRGAPLDYWEKLRRGGTLRHSDDYLDFVTAVLRAEEACANNDCEEAIDYFEDAVDLRPDRKGMIGHIRALAQLRRFDESLELVASGLERDPDSAELYEIKTIILAAADRHEEALDSYRSALRLNPYDPDLLVIGHHLWRHLTDEKEKLGDMAAVESYRLKAKGEFEKALVYGAPRADVQLAWARSLLVTGAPREEAYTAFKEAIRLAPRDPEYILHYGNSRAAVEDCSALKVFEQFRQACTKYGTCDRYVSYDVLTGSLIRRCDKSDAARRKRMTPQLLSAMTSCNKDFETAEPNVAIEQCLRKAEAGDAAAAYDLGIIYSRGFAVDFDESSGLRWLEIAAERGHRMAKLLLGNYLYEGIGAEADPVRGRRLLREAADAGEADAMFTLGMIYHLGKHDDQDLEESRHWFVEAADRGSEHARRALKRLFGEDYVSR